MKRIPLIASIMAICSLPTLAHADDHTGTAIMDSAYAFVAAKNCPNVQINWPFLIKFMRFYGVESDDIGTGGKYYNALMAETAAALIKYNDNTRVFCMVASNMFQKSDPKLLIGE